MNKLLTGLSGLLFSVASFAQSYNPGLPLPGLPKSLGQKAMTGSTSVVIASDQTPISITGSITATNPSVGTNYAVAPGSATLIGGIGESGLLAPFLMTSNGGITVSVNGPITISGTVPVSMAGVATENTLLAVSANAITINANMLNGLQKSQISDALGVTVTVRPVGSALSATDNGLVTNGILQGLDSGGSGAYIPARVNALGSLEVNATQGTSPWVVSVPAGVVISGTASLTPITVTASTISRIANSVASQTLLAANGSRKAAFLFNDSSTTNCYVKLGATASATSFTLKLFATDTYIMDPPTYTGVIDYICDAASGSMEVTEQ